MEELEVLARKHAVAFEMKEGDVLWSNNMGLLHARDAYKDTNVQV